MNNTPFRLSPSTPRSTLHLLHPVFAAGLALCLLAACAKRDRSPIVFCEFEGKLVETAFTFDAFRSAMEAEHGYVEVQPDAILRSQSLEVEFRRMGEGRLQATCVRVRATGKELPPAVLFGLSRGDVLGASLPQIPDASGPVTGLVIDVAPAP